MALFPLVSKTALGSPFRRRPESVFHHGRSLGQNCPPGQFWDGKQCRSSLGPIPGGAGVPSIPTAGPAAGPASGATTPSSTPGTPGSSGAPPQQNLIACINGPDLYDIYNPGMSLVAKGVLNPNASYPNSQINFAKSPPCPVPQATGVGGLCDIPLEYLAPKGGGGPSGKPVLACYVPNHGVTLIDYVTGAPIGTHLNGACLSLLSDVTIAQPGDPRCTGVMGGGTPPVTPPISSVSASSGSVPTQSITPPVPVTPPSGTIPTQPIQQPTPPPLSMPTQPIQAPASPGAAPWDAYGSATGIPAPSYAPPGIPTQPISQPAFSSSPERMMCVNNPPAKTMTDWFESCPNIKKARGY